jgi:lipopolysaccharide export system permease protein
VRIETQEANKFMPSSSSRATRELVADPTPGNQAELIWRVGIPVSALILSLLAVPMSFVNPRAGRSLNIILAILLYMVYSNLISISQSWVGRGKLPPLAGWTGVHVAMALLLAFLVWRRMAVTPLLWGLRR